MTALTESDRENIALTLKNAIANRRPHHPHEEVAPVASPPPPVAVTSRHAEWCRSLGLSTVIPPTREAQIESVQWALGRLDRKIAQREERLKFAGTDAARSGAERNLDALDQERIAALRELYCLDPSAGPYIAPA